MKVRDILSRKARTCSCEVFPPKKDTEVTLREYYEIGLLRPDYMSVTYGAGGNTVDKVRNINPFIQEECMVPVVQHVTCTMNTKDTLFSLMRVLKIQKVENLFVIRGDLSDTNRILTDEFNTSTKLIDYIRKTEGDSFCVGAACYPELHPEYPSVDAGLQYMYEKQQAGADYFVTQVFFDNDKFLRFLDKARSHGITVPIIPGLMPITSANQLGRMINMSNCSITSEINKILDRDDFAERFIHIFHNQLEDLRLHGIKNFHIYTMNKPFTTREALSIL